MEEQREELRAKGKTGSKPRNHVSSSSGNPPSTKHSTTSVLHALSSFSSQSHDVDLPAHSNYSAAFIRCGMPIQDQCHPSTETVGGREERGEEPKRNHSGVRDTKGNAKYMRESRLRRVWKWR